MPALRSQASVSASLKRRIQQVSDEEPGITRRRCGKGFAYYRPDGTLIQNASEKKRIASLVIPPAWKDVWICPKESGHIQATGTDDAGRKQYIYHQDWQRLRQQEKFSRLAAFGKRLPKLRRLVGHKLNIKQPSKEKAIAAAIRLLDDTWIRVGQHRYLAQSDTTGLVTLQNEHVEFHNDTLRLSFKGKSNVQHEIELCDQRLVEALESLESLNGDFLFQYQDEHKDVHPLSANDINQRLEAWLDGAFTAKAFRTWGGSLVFVENYFIQQDEKDPHKRRIAAVKAAAERLRNTPAVALEFYIHPQLPELAERCLPKLQTIAQRSQQKRLVGLSKGENLLLYLLTNSQ